MSDEFGLRHGWLELVKSCAAQKSEIREVWIFGSRARGDYRSASDVDIAVKLCGETPGEKNGIFIFEAEDWTKELQRFTPVTIDLDHGDEDCDSEIVVPAVRREGKRIFP
jgi:predicted nucleotidyltransferase